VNSPEGVAALTYYKKQLNVAPPGDLTYDWFDTIGALCQDKVAMMCHWLTGEAENPETSVIVGKAGYGHVPYSKEYGKSRPAFGGWSWGVGKNSPNVEAAWSFLKWLIHPDTQDFMVSTGKFFTPVTNSTYAKYAAKNRQFKPIIDNLPYSDTEYRPRIPEYPKMEEILGLRLNQAMIGELGIKEALDTANNEIAKLLKSTGKL